MGKKNFITATIRRRTTRTTGNKSELENVKSSERIRKLQNRGRENTLRNKVKNMIKEGRGGGIGDKKNETIIK